MSILVAIKNLLWHASVHIRFFSFFQRGETNLENVTHEDAVATLKTTQDRVVLIVAKPESAFNAPISDPPYSPQLCKSNNVVKV